MTENSNKIYLDYAATTPVDPAVLRAMTPYFSEKFGNAGSLHSFGQEAIAAVDQSRETIAKAIGAEFREVIFTASATEANNLALRGLSRTGRGLKLTNLPSGVDLLRDSPRIVCVGPRPRIIVSSIEHESVLETARDLEKEGVEVIYLSVDKAGVVNLKKLKESLNEDTILVSVMYVNNEIGTIQPIAEIAKIIQEFKEKATPPNLPSDPSQASLRDAFPPLGKGRGYLGKGRKKSSYPLSAIRYPLLHCDASQAFNYLDCNVDALGVDLMTLSSHKIYGPKGAASLYIYGNSESSLSAIRYPLISGGGQEFGLRSGTENVPAIVGFAKAVEIASAMREKESKRIAGLREYFWQGIKKIYPKAEINGVAPDSYPLSAIRYPLVSPHILNIYFPSHDAQDILTRLDLAGVAASSGSACRSRAMESSYVIKALSHSKARAKSSVRFSFGRQTTKQELDKVLKILKVVVGI